MSRFYGKNKDVCRSWGGGAPACPSPTGEGRDARPTGCPSSLNHPCKINLTPRPGGRSLRLAPLGRAAAGVHLQGSGPASSLISPPPGMVCRPGPRRPSSARSTPLRRCCAGRPAGQGRARQKAAQFRCRPGPGPPPKGAVKPSAEKGGSGRVGGSCGYFDKLERTYSRSPGPPRRRAGTDQGLCANPSLGLAAKGLADAEIRHAGRLGRVPQAAAGTSGRPRGKCWSGAGPTRPRRVSKTRAAPPRRQRRWRSRPRRPWSGVRKAVTGPWGAAPPVCS